MARRKAKIGALIGVDFDEGDWRSNVFERVMEPGDRRVAGECSKGNGGNGDLTKRLSFPSGV